MTDIPRLRAGMVGGQFWSVWVPVEITGAQAVETTLEQIDLVKRLAAKYPADLELALTAADVRRIHRAGRIAALIGIEGGHQIDNSLAVLRQMYDLGARYMTLTHVRNTAWADAATDAPAHHGLTAFGEEVVREMNRLGMLVDLSHVSPDTMKAALGGERRAGHVFPLLRARHRRSSARCARRRARAGREERRRRDGEFLLRATSRRRATSGMRTGPPSRRATTRRPMAACTSASPSARRRRSREWERAHPKPGDDARASGRSHRAHPPGRGRRSRRDSVRISTASPKRPRGLEGVDRFPALLIELMRRGWTDADIAKVAGENVLRVMAACERVAAELRRERAPSEAQLDAGAH